MIKRKNAIQKGDYVYLKKTELSKKHAIIRRQGIYRVVNVLGNDLEILEHELTASDTFIVKKNEVRNAKKYLTQEGSCRAEKKSRFCFLAMGFCKLYFVGVAICLMVLTIIGKTEFIKYFSLSSIVAVLSLVAAQIFSRLDVFYNGLATLFSWQHISGVNNDTPTEGKQ